MLENDLKLLARQWENFEIPKDKKYLLKYFDTDLQVIFLKYYLIFGDYKNFVDHTGFKCGEIWLDFLCKKLQIILKAHKDAKTNPDMELGMKEVSVIQSGKFKFSSDFVRWKRKKRT